MFRHRELLKAIREHRLCDFIGSEYWCFSKEELKDIIVELACAAFYNGDKEFEDDTMRLMASELEEAWEGKEEED